VLFVVAHQDDECFMSTRIAREVRQGHRVLFACLTDGTAKGVRSGRRNAESTRVLTGLGLASSDLFFTGSARSIPDGRLHDHFGNAFEGLRNAFRSVAIDEIYTTAYEGGHQDHDATHVIAVALAREHDVVDCTFQMPLYNGFQTRWKFFSVGKPLAANGPLVERSLEDEGLLSHAMLCRHYPSQRVPWLGLFPGRFVQLCLRRREAVQRVVPMRIRERPHDGPLLYERRGGPTFGEFCARRDAFLPDNAGDESS
jgi:LmbE family N-acetylglucosaminyl deacetylase